MNIKEIKDGLQTNNFVGLRARLDTVIEFIDEQQAEIEVLKKRYEPKIVDMCLRTDEQGRVLPQREIK